MPVTAGLRLWQGMLRRQGALTSFSSQLWSDGFQTDKFIRIARAFCDAYLHLAPAAIAVRDTDAMWQLNLGHCQALGSGCQLPTAHRLENRNSDRLSRLHCRKARSPRRARESPVHVVQKAMLKPEAMALSSRKKAVKQKDGNGNFSCD